MSSTPQINSKSPLEAAQNLVAELTGMTSEHQSLALKFAIETLGLQIPAVFHPSVVAQPIHSAQPTPPHVVNGAENSTDIRSFTAMKSPKSDQQFAAVVAYFYQFEAKPANRKDEIDAEIMKEAARLAGRAQVTRWNMTLTNAKNAGYLDSAGTGKFKLSSVGENLVAITLPGNGGSGQGSGANKKKKAKAKKTSPKKSAKKKG